MIQKTKEEAALKALHAVVLKGRELAYEKASHSAIADLLDGVEYLVALFYDPDDMTETYLKYIKEMAEEFGCRSVLELFDETRH